MELKYMFTPSSRLCSLFILDWSRFAIIHHDGTITSTYIWFDYIRILYKMDDLLVGETFQWKQNIWCSIQDPLKEIFFFVVKDVQALKFANCCHRNTYTPMHGLPMVSGGREGEGDTRSASRKRKSSLPDFTHSLTDGGAEAGTGHAHQGFTDCLRTAPLASKAMTNC